MVAELIKKIFLPAFTDAGADTSFKGGVDDISESHESDEALLLPGGYDNNDVANSKDAMATSEATRSATSSPTLLQPFDTNIWIVNGPVVNFYGFDYPTRMVVIKIRDAEDESSSCAWLWSPIEYSKQLETEIIQTVGGPIKHIVSPNKIHWLYMKSWQEQYPNAIYYGSPGLQERGIAKDLRFDTVLSNETPKSYSNDIKQIIFESGLLDEVIFFHIPTRTVIFCDLIQRHPIGYHKGIAGTIMKLEGVVGPTGSTPKEWILCFWLYNKYYTARQTLNTILYDWQPLNLIIAHGDNYHHNEDRVSDTNAIQVIENCLLWIPIDPKEPGRGRGGCICCNNNSD